MISCLENAGQAGIKILRKTRTLGSNHRKPRLQIQLKKSTRMMIVTKWASQGLGTHQGACILIVGSQLWAAKS